MRDYLVAHSDLLGYATRRSLKAAPPQFQFAEISIKELERSRHVCVTYRKDGYLSPAGRRLMDILKKMTREDREDDWRQPRNRSRTPEVK
jgi:hypothetical protein